MQYSFYVVLHKQMTWPWWLLSSTWDYGIIQFVFHNPITKRKIVDHYDTLFSGFSKHKVNLYNYKTLNKITDTTCDGLS